MTDEKQRPSAQERDLPADAMTHMVPVDNVGVELTARQRRMAWALWVVARELGERHGAAGLDTVACQALAELAHESGVPVEAYTRAMARGVILGSATSRWREQQ